MKTYIRFAEIPKDFRSKIYRNGIVVDEEKGVSVWDCMEVDGLEMPLYPQSPSMSALGDYYSYLIRDDLPIYLVSGTEIGKGYDGEPLLGDDIKVIKDLSKDYKYRKSLYRGY